MHGRREKKGRRREIWCRVKEMGMAKRGAMSSGREGEMGRERERDGGR